MWRFICSILREGQHGRILDSDPGTLRLDWCYAAKEYWKLKNDSKPFVRKDAGKKLRSAILSRPGIVEIQELKERNNNDEVTSRVFKMPPDLFTELMNQARESFFEEYSWSVNGPEPFLAGWPSVLPTDQKEDFDSTVMLRSALYGQMISVPSIY